MTAVVPGGLNPGHLAETIEAALDAEDLNPLVIMDVCIVQHVLPFHVPQSDCLSADERSVQD